VKVYFDTSVILRAILGEPGRLAEWSRVVTAVTSELTRVESLRALDRLRLDGGMSDREVGRRRASALRLLEGVQTVRVNRAVLDRAAEPFPTRLRSLDAVHLASAMLARARIPDLRFATHDDELAVAAEAVGLPVIGI
jgi:predicted nucleic acid-binding protein